MIDILVPVLNRPQNIRPLLRSIRLNTDHKRVNTVVIMVSEDDWAEQEELMNIDPAGPPLMGVLEVLANKTNDYPIKMNKAFAATADMGSEFLLLASDDLDFQPGWDTEALRIAEETGAGVIGTNDKANGQVIRGQFSTQPLVRRAYIEEYGGTATDGPGVLLHEGYDHNFVERELAGMAMSRGQWAFARNSIIRHRHPNWRTAPNDSTYEKGLKNFQVDQELFWSRAHHWNYEGLSPSERRRARQMASA